MCRFYPEAIARGVSLAPFLPDAKRNGICPGSNGSWSSAPAGVSHSNTWVSETFVPPVLKSNEHVFFATTTHLSKSPRFIRVISYIAISKHRTCNLTAGRRNQSDKGIPGYHRVFFFTRLLIESFWPVQVLSSFFLNLRRQNLRNRRNQGFLIWNIALSRPEQRPHLIFIWYEKKHFKQSQSILKLSQIKNIRANQYATKSQYVQFNIVTCIISSLIMYDLLYHNILSHFFWELITSY